MFEQIWRSWRAQSRQGRRSRIPLKHNAPRSFHPRLEPLEERRLLALIVWDGEGGDNNWNNAANWFDQTNLVNNVLPGMGDDAQIGAAFAAQTITHSIGTTTINSVSSEASLIVSGGSFSLAAASSVNNAFALSGGGTLTGAGTITVGGLLTWSGGSMGGSGTTVANGGLVLNGAFKTLSLGRTLTNTGAATWSAGAFINSNGAITNNGTFDVQFDSAFDGGGQFNNAGTFTKSAGAGETRMIATFNNSGAVHVNSGTLTLELGGTSSGSFQGTGTLEFNGHTLGATSSVTTANVVFGVGLSEINGSYNVAGSTTIISGPANFIAVANVLNIGSALNITGFANFSSGEAINPTTLTLTGSGTLAGSDTVTVSGLTTWSGGSMGGSGTTVANGGLVLNGAVKTLNIGRTLTNTGAATWSAGAFINSNGAITNNGTFDVQFNSAFDGGGVFNNAGAFTKSAGAGETRMIATFNNSGAVHVNSGTLTLEFGGTSSGSFQGSGTLEFNAHTLTATSSVTTANVVFGTGLSEINGSYNVAGSTTIISGPANFNALANVVSVGSSLNIMGAANFNSGEAINPTTLTISGSGTLSGSDTVTISGLTTWSGGTMSGPGITNANGGLMLQGSTKSLHLGRTLNNNGVAVWSAGNISGGGGAVFNNTSAGSIDLQFDGVLNYNLGGAQPQFHNAGTFTKSGGAGSALVLMAFTTSGTVTVSSGRLVAGNGGTFAANLFDIQTGTVNASGTINADVNNDSTLNPGTSPGLLTIIGNYNQTSTSALNIELGGTTAGAGYDQLNVIGDVALNGSLNVSLFGGFMPALPQTFTIINNDDDDSISGTFAGLAEGATLIAGGAMFTVSYAGGTGNDVVLTFFMPPETSVEVIGGVLTVTDINTISNDTLLVRRDPGDSNFLLVSDPNRALQALAGTTQVDPLTARVPIASLTGITVNTSDGQDSLELQASLVEVLLAQNIGLTYNAGNPTMAPGDSLTLSGGTWDSVTYNHTNASSGTVQITKASTGAGTAQISFNGIEPLINTGTASNVVFNLTSNADNAVLEDDGIPGNGLMRLRSSNASFEVTTFAVPSESLTINAGAGNDTIVIDSVDSLYGASLTINGDVGADIINFNGDITLAANRSLTATAETVNVNAGSDLTTGGTGLVTFTADFMAISATATIISASTVTLQPQSTGRQIFVGTEDVNRLSLTDAELDRITAGLVQVGSNITGSLFVHAPITHGNHLSITNNTMAADSRSMEINASITMAVDKNLTITGLGDARSPVFTNNSGTSLVTSGTGVLTIAAASGLQLGSGTTLSTENGGISLSADASGTSASNSAGVHVLQAQIVTTGTGPISIIGRGSPTTQKGVSIVESSVRSTSSTNLPAQGTISIHGTGGSVFSSNVGVAIGGTSPGTFVESNSGDISITGQGGLIGNAGSIQNDGVDLTGSGIISAANQGSVTIQGTAGGNGIGVLTFVQIQTQQGNIQILGVSGPDGPGSEAGVWIDAGPIASTTGAILIEGDGAAGVHGVLMRGLTGSGTLIATTGGSPITVQGTAGTGAGGLATVLTVGSFATLISSSGPLTFIGDSFSFTGDGSTSSGTVNFVPLTPGTPISLGGGDILTGVKRLGLADFDLDRTLAGTINVGDATTGNITVDAAVVPATNRARHMTLTTAGDIIFNAELATVGFFNLGSPTVGNLLLNPGPSGTVQPKSSTSDATTQANLGSAFTTSFATGSDLAIAVNGVTPHAQYDRLTAVGMIDLTGVDLALTGSYAPLPGNSFLIVDNNGTDPIIGAFNGLPQNANVMFGGAPLTLSYTGGDGNDVVLSFDTPADTTVQVSAGVLTITDVHTASNDTLLIRVDPLDSNFLLVSDPNLIVEALAGATGVDAHTVRVPRAGLTSIVVNTLDGQDALELHSTLMEVLIAQNIGFTYNAGNPLVAPGDSLTLTGGVWDSVTYSHINASDGTIQITNAALGPGMAQIAFNGIEPLTNTGTATNVVFNLTAGVDDAILEDDGIPGNGLMRLRSANASFETTTFAVPTGSLTISGLLAADVITVDGVDSTFNANLTINGGAGNDTVTINDLGSGFGANLTINGGIGNDTVNLLADITFALGNSLDVNLNNDGGASTGTDQINVGPFTFLSVSGTGSIMLAASQSVVLTSSSLSAVNGNITISGNELGALQPSAGVDVNGSLVRTTGSGNINATGQGHVGVWVRDGGRIEGGTSGLVSVVGSVSVTGTSTFSKGVLVSGFVGSTPSGITSSGANISVMGTGGTSGGNGKHGVEVERGARISAGGLGNVTVQGTAGGGATGSQNHGVFVDIPVTPGGGVVFEPTISSAGGNVSITGVGGPGAAFNVGVFLADGIIHADGSGMVTIHGTAVATGGNLSSGVRVLGGFGDSPSITSVNGDISITGISNATGSGVSNFGMAIAQSSGPPDPVEIRSQGTGNITIVGTGGLATGTANIGIFFNSTNTITVASAGGNISLTGTGRGTGASTDNRGLDISSADLSTTGSGSISIAGTGGIGSGVGFAASGGSDITTQDGNITVAGAAGGVFAVGNVAVNLSGAGLVHSTGTGDISITADTISLLKPLNASGNIVSIKQQTAGRAIDLGGADSATHLGFISTEVSNITAATLIIGDANSGTLTVSAATISSGKNVQLVSGEDVVISGGQIATGAGTLLLDSGTTPAAVRPIRAGVDVFTSRLSFGSDLAIVIDGTAPDTEYTQLNVAGEVDLTGVSLALSGSHVPTPGNSFMIVNNDGSDAIIGAFTGLPEGSLIPFNGQQLRISYIGGTGNDVVLAYQVSFVGDYGDAPDTYGTLLASNGARHSAVGPVLGTTPDVESDASLPLNGTGDDVTNTGSADDETGVSAIGTGFTLLAGASGSATVTINASSGNARLYGWIDFNRDGDFADAGEQIALGDTLLTDGMYMVNFAVPANASAGNTYARFRVSTQAGLSFDGAATDGEVEDYALAIHSTLVTSASDVVSASDAGNSLREAILAANLWAGTNTISFNIPGGGVRTIQPLTALPEFTQTVIIDGYTQPGASPNTNPLTLGAGALGSNAVLMIEIDGSLQTTGGSILDIQPSAGGSIIRGLVVNRSRGDGIVVWGNGSVVAGNFIGIDPTGMIARPNAQRGVNMAFSAHNLTVGGSSPAARNVISGNLRDGVATNGNDNIVRGNLIGSDATGTASLGNWRGVFVNGGSNTQILENLISASDLDNIYSTGSVIIRGNFIGPDISGTASLYGGISGIHGGIQIQADIGFASVTIGGPLPADCNVISGNLADGITLVRTAGSGHTATIRNNYIGLQADGVSPLGNVINGIQAGTASGSFVWQGPITIQDNRIAFNGQAGGSLRNATAHITQNSIYSNGALGIDRGAAGVTNLPATPIPTLTSLGTSGGNTTVSGTLTGKVNTAYTLEFFSSVARDPSGFGEGQTYRGSTMLTTDGSGLASFTATLASLVPGGHWVTATATETPANDTFEFSNAIQTVAATDLAVSVTDNPDPVVAGNNLAYTITVTNTGAEAQGVSLTSVLPTGVTFVSWTAPVGWTKFDPVLENGFTATASIATLPAGAMAVFTLVVTVNADVDAGTMLGNLVSISNTNGDTNPANNTETEQTHVCNFIVTNTLDSGPGSLREVILCANLVPGLQTITFAIPGAGVQTISPLSALPTITDPVVIDGFSQAGASPNTNPLASGSNAALLIEINGASAGPNVDGLLITAPGSTVRGLVINRFSGDGIEVRGSGASATSISGNYLGTDAGGLAHLGNSQNGVFINGAPNAFIGGGLPEQRNLISGNGKSGVQISGVAATDNLVQGNLIGTNASGTAAIGNAAHGIFVNSSGNIIGGTMAGEGNVISGNAAVGVAFQSASATSNLVLGNYLGLSADGAAALGNQLGVSFGDQASNNTVGGTAMGAGNVISGNFDVGIRISGFGGPISGMVIQNNLIGTDNTGMLPLGNGAGGIFVGIGASNNTIGGTVLGTGNVISGNHDVGIRITNDGTTGNVVQGNFIGTTSTGAGLLGNAGHGIYIDGAPANLIGGASPGAGNIIAGNQGYGVRIADFGTAVGNVIQGNRLGVDINGAALGNTSGGLLADAPSTNVGGVLSGEGNIIAHNGGAGIVVSNTSTPGVAIRGNSIHSNAGLGIDLGNDGPTANDTGDGDTGPNNLQNFPVLTQILHTATQTAVQGTLNSTAGGTFRIEFFANLFFDETCHGEGQNLLGSITITDGGVGDTDPTPGNVGFAFTALGDFRGNYLTMTATNTSAMETSEFSLAYAVTSYVVVNTADSGPGSLRAAMACANMVPNIDRDGIAGVEQDQITFNIAMPPTDAVSWWKANYHPDDAVDSNNGTLVTGATYAPGKVGHAFSLDGIDDFVEVPSSPGLEITGDVTVEFWAQRNSLGQAHLISKGVGNDGAIDAPSAYVMRFDTNNRLLGGFERADGSNAELLGPQVTDNGFHHYAYVREGNRHSLFLDGVEVASETFTGNPGNSSAYALTIGAVYNDLAPLGIERHFSGLIDEVAIFARPLSANEVRDIFNAGSLGKLNRPNIVSLYKAEATPDDTADGSGGTLLHGATFAAGKLGQGFSLDGVDDEIALPGTRLGTLDITGNQLTIEAWVFTTDHRVGGTGQTIFDKWFDGQPNGYGLDLQDGRLRLQGATTNSGGAFGVTAPTPVPLNTWTHVAATYDGSRVRLYMDGVEQFSAPLTGDLLHNNQDAAIGNDNNPALTDSGLIGRLDEVGVYRRALTPGEIQERVNSGNGIHSTLRTITPTSALPTVTEPVIIDAYTQPGAAPNSAGPGLGGNAILLVELNGQDLGTNVSGLHITSGGSTVRGLVINRFLDVGITLSGGGGNTIEGNYLGTNAAGTAIVGATSLGLRIMGGSGGNTVGGTAPASRNLISGNIVGVRLEDVGTDNNVIVGNFLGTDVSGTMGFTFDGTGVDVTGGAVQNRIGGLTAAERNIISAFSHGVTISAASQNVLQGNYIGTDVTGMLPLGNGSGGIFVGIGASNNTIGGTLPGARNVISGNHDVGIRITNDGTTGNVVQGNFIGTTSTGAGLLGNAGHGIYIDGAPANLIGGPSPGTGNVIAGNQGYGIRVADVGTAAGNVIQGNRLGIDINGMPLGNSSGGLLIDAPDTHVGGSLAGEGNIIAHNGGPGVVVAGTSPPGVAILGNSIYSNAGLGIDLGSDGPTLNDVGDGDTGPNNLQNFPILTQVITTATETTVIGTLDSTVGGTFRIEFFASMAADASGFGEGQMFLGSVTVTDSDNDGLVTFNFMASGDFRNQFITSTATNTATGETSEFSDNQPTGTGETELAVTISDSPDPVVAGNNLTYTITVTNNGGDAQNAMFTDMLPAGVTFVSFAGPQGWTTSTPPVGGTGAVTASIATLPAGATAVFTLVVNVSGLSVAGTTLANSVGIASSTSDTNPGNDSDTALTHVCNFVVTNINDSGPGSLREVILCANLVPGLQTITFAIPGVGVQTISPLTSLPTITDPVVIDGYTQPGAMVNSSMVGFNGILLIELDGQNTSSDGLTLGGIGGSTVRGLVINRFGNDGINIHTGGGNTVAGNFIGTDPTGAIGLGNANTGIEITSGLNTIGGPSPADRNIIADNDGSGMFVFGSGADGNIIQNNYIGTNAAGDARLSNDGGGVFGLGVSNTRLIGNLISGNFGGGVFIDNDDGAGITSGTVIQGNSVGTNATGTAALSNVGGGVFIVGAPDTVVGGAAPGEPNLISGNFGGGLFIVQDNNTGAGSHRTIVQGNRIGTDITGTFPLLTEDFTNPGVYVPQPSAVVVEHSNDVAIGGATPGAGNLLSGGAQEAIFVGSASGVMIQGNLIGTQADGTTPVPNERGIFITGSTGTIVGGTAAGAGNVIANNGTGIVVTASTGTSIVGNSIRSNLDLGIDLDNDGPTENDIGDLDGGANGLQNFPVFTSVTASGANSRIQGTLESTPLSTFRIEFFSNATLEPSFHGEGETFLGSINVMTDSSGLAIIDFTTSNPVPARHFITATATDSVGNTSEFSKAPMDFGDAPEPFVPGGFPAAHVLTAGAPFIGTLATDADVFNPSTPLAMGDDSGGVDDEDGVTIGSGFTLFSGQPSTATVLLNGSDGTARLYGWIDFNADGDWDDLGEQIADGSTLLGNGLHQIVFQTPVSGFVPATYARFRVSREQGLGSSGIAGEGEVEDYALAIQPATPQTVLINIGDATAVEGNIGTAIVELQVTLSQSSSQPIIVLYATADGTAGSADYESLAGTLSFAPGELTQTAMIMIKGDLLDEANETFLVQLTNALGASIADGEGVATIADDDLPPTITISGSSVVEGDFGNANAHFDVFLSAPSGQPVEVQFATADGTATTSDYQSTSGVLSFAHGQTSRQITVQVLPDLLDETDETFQLVLSNPVHAMLPATQATGTILDNDQQPTLSIDDVTVREPKSGTAAAVFTVKLSTPSSLPIQVAFNTTNDTATSGDYQHVSGTLTFAPLERSKIITVTVNSDLLDEADETFHLELSSAVHATISDPQGLGTILNFETGTSIIAVGADAGAPPLVRVFDASTLKLLSTIQPYNGGFLGGVRVAAGDVNGDDRLDIITAAGPGGGSHVRIFDALTGLQLPGPIGSFFAYPGFFGGLFVAAGDVNGDGADDVITGADAGGGPHVKVFDGRTGQLLPGPIGSFMAYKTGANAGVRVAAGDVDGDGHADVITGMGPGYGDFVESRTGFDRISQPQVRAFSGSTGAMLRSFVPFEGYRGGVHLTAGMVNGDDKADIVVSTARGDGLTDRVFQELHSDPYNGPDVAVFQGGSFASMAGLRLGNASSSMRLAIIDELFRDFEPATQGDDFLGPALIAGSGSSADLSIYSQQQRLLDRLVAFDPLLPHGVWLAAASSDVSGATLNQVFDEQYYLVANPDVAHAVALGAFSSGRQHYDLYGRFEPRSVSPLFNDALYLQQNPDVAMAIQQGRIQSALSHFLDFGQFEGRRFSSLFDESIYRQANPDVVAAVYAGVFRSELEHFLLFGQHEGRKASLLFDEQFYLNSNPDVASAVAQGVFRSGLRHFLLYGQREGRAGS